MTRPTQYPVAIVTRFKKNPSRDLRLLFVLWLLIGVACAALADSAPVTVVVGEKPVPFVVGPYVDTDGQVYVPVDVVHLLGATYTPNADGRTVAVTTASGTTFDAPFQFVRSRFCIPMMRYADQLGASAKWDEHSRTLTLRARLVMVRADETGLSITTSYPVYYKVGKLDKGTKQDPIRRIYVDLTGVDLAAAPATIPSTEPGIAYIRTGYFGDGIARIVIDLNRKLSFRVDSPVSASVVRVAMNGVGDAIPSRVATAQPTTPAHQSTINPTVPVQTAPIEPLPVTVPVAPTTPAPTATTDTNTPPATADQTGLRITQVTSNVVSPLVTEITVKTSAATKYRWITLDNPSRLAFDLAGAGLDTALPASEQVGSTVVKDVRAGTITAGTTEFGRVVIDLAQAVDFSVSTQQVDDGMVYTISLQRPDIAPLAITDQLKGKVVMVDPGHGGQDTGAVDTVGGYREKDFTLAIAKKLRDDLARAGATVYMTREDDILPSVAARPKMAIAVGADYFISIHCDESGERDSHSGTTVYYHGQNQTCRRLALNIVNRVAAVSGLSQNGVKSDTIRFHTGFGVLRGSPMPAVLVECGYMNNSADVAKLRTDDVQEHIAEGIVRGLIDFNTGG